MAKETQREIESERARMKKMSREWARARVRAIHTDEKTNKCTQRQIQGASLSIPWQGTEARSYIIQ